VCAWSLAATLLIATSMASLRLRHGALSVQGGFFSRLVLPVSLTSSAVLLLLPPPVGQLLLHPLPVSWPLLRPRRLRRHPSFLLGRLAEKVHAPCLLTAAASLLRVPTHDRTCAWLFHFPLTAVAGVEEGSRLYPVVMNGGRYTPCSTWDSVNSVCSSRRPRCLGWRRVLYTWYSVGIVCIR